MSSNRGRFRVNFIERSREDHRGTTGERHDGEGVAQGCRPRPTPEKFGATGGHVPEEEDLKVQHPSAGPTRKDTSVS